jgi:hypothetical protein
MSVVAVIAPDGSIIESLMADIDDPALRDRFPGARFIVPPAGVQPGQGWTYSDAAGFEGGAATNTNPVWTPEQSKQIDF